ncbi:MAG: hypothetical protein UU65_C0006G0003 [candidate division CPR2 bacterium GW2011_GWC1_41_48]|uniref:Uncharacterized protein n=1 Tax=candidate division CPR2 bacterium GW2011_GWC1_41_48 TaxID=1618344 RepID=A0A0G0Z6I2_UNCC2|nr:MAG: hypothetical protein UU65_C0006G0003 [candidate division CPR2 bacterium GW2011_GWC1_41_48]
MGQFKIDESNNIAITSVNPHNGSSFDSSTHANGNGMISDDIMSKIQDTKDKESDKADKIVGSH